MTCRHVWEIDTKAVDGRRVSVNARPIHGVIEIGVEKWSYSPEVTKDIISDLDGKTSRWIFDQILDRSVIDDEAGEG